MLIVAIFQIEKLYGHGYEIISLAAGHQTSIIAVACKATSAEHAVIRLYDTKTWKPSGNILDGHALTITSICFSSDDRFLLSVSRDRSWRLYEKVEGKHFTSEQQNDAAWNANVLTNYSYRWKL